VTDERPPTLSAHEQVTEIWELIVAYTKQETVDPLSKIGVYLAWGVAGALFLGFGFVFLTMSVLRALQTETGTTFTGNWSWVPYFIVVVGLVLVASLFWWARGARRKEPS